MKLILLFLLLLPFVEDGKNEKGNTYWYSDFSLAKEAAISENKPLLIFFSGSDWCKPCIKLKKDVIETEAFLSASSKQFVLYNADFPIYNKQDKSVVNQNEKLAEKFNPEGKFPKVVIVSVNDELLADMGYYECTPEEYLGILMSKLDDSRVRKKEF